MKSKDLQKAVQRHQGKMRMGFSHNGVSFYPALEKSFFITELQTRFKDDDETHMTLDKDGWLQKV